MAKKKRKIRITKKEIRKIRDENKITSAQAKKRIMPGPWTNKETKLKVNASLRLSCGVMSEILGPAYGNYTKETLFGEKGWYPIVFNIEAKDIAKTIEKNGMDDFLAACEKSLSNQEDKDGKSKYGTVIIMTMCVDNSKNKEFVSCRGKTNKKSIPGFRAIRKGELIVIEL